MSKEQFAPDFSPLDHTRRDSYITQPLDIQPVNGEFDDETTFYQPLPQHARRTGVGTLLWRTGVGVGLVAAVTLGGSLWYYNATFRDRIYPNVAVRGVQIGQSSPAQAEAALRAQHQAFVDAPLTLTFEGRSWRPTLDDIGGRLEIGKAVESAFATGRGPDMVGNVQQVAAVWNHGLELPVELTIDQQRLQAYLGLVAAEIEHPATDAQLRIDGTEPTVDAAQPGRQVLVGETMLEITAALQQLAPQEVVVRTRLVEPVLADAQAREAAAVARTYLQGPLVLAAGDQNWEIPTSDIASMLRLETATTAAGKAISVRLDPSLLNQKLQEIADATRVKGTNPRLDWNGGDLQIIAPGTPGREIDFEAARKLVIDAVNNSARTVELPFRELQPEVNQATLGSLGIKELVGVGRSDFSGSEAYRVTNVVNGMRILYGIVLAPGEEFSFNKHIGEINAANGFVEGYAIVENRTQTEYGGGICQDSTTIFRAAFWAGLPITERWGHSFYISWYDRYGYGDYGDGAGMDATIFTGGPDLKFVNDTGNWLLIQSYADPYTGLAEVRLYGTKPNRSVELIGPEVRNRVPAPTKPEYVGDPEQPRGTIRQSDTARGGMDIFFSRVIVENGVRQPPERFVTTFKAWPNIFVVNPADLARYQGGQVVEEATPEASPTTDPAAPPAAGDPAAPAPAEPAPATTDPAAAPTEAVPAEPAPAPVEPAPVEPEPAVPDPAPAQEGQPIGNAP